MARYFAQLDFKGTNYQGWQKQISGKAVQDFVEKAFSLYLGSKVDTMGCGRTDQGVHAKGFWFHFDLTEELTQSYQTLVYKINRILPLDISLRKIVAVHETAHARFDADSRSYEYRLSNIKQPFENDLVAFYPFKELDLEKMNEISRRLIEIEDFASFAKSGHDAKTTRCKLQKSEWTFDSEKQIWVYNIVGDRFLRGMVRLISGMCIRIGTHQDKIEDIWPFIQSGEILPYPLSLPSNGLTLKNITYPFKL
jgi:tRNA pseudouridine38-40 synthase